MLKENRTLNVESHYFDDNEDPCKNKILEENKLETAVKFKDVSGRNRPVRLGFKKCKLITPNLYLFSCVSWQRSGVKKTLYLFLYKAFPQGGQVSGLAVSHCSPFHLGGYHEAVRDCYVQDFQNTVIPKLSKIENLIDIYDKNYFEGVSLLLQVTSLVSNSMRRTRTF